MKKLLKISCLLLMVMTLTGCMKMNVNVEVKADKTMAMGMELLAEETMFTGTGTSAEDWVEQMKEQILSSAEMKDAKTTPITKTIDGVEWVGINVEYTSDEASTSTYLIEKEIDGKDCLEITLPMDNFNDQMNGTSLETSGYSVSKLKAMGMEMNITIKMPGKVTSNIGKVDGNSVTIDLLELMASGKTEDIVISSPLSDGSMMTYALIGVGVVAIVAIVLVILKKKKKPVQEEVVYDATPDVSTPVEEVKEETVQSETVNEPMEEKAVEESNEEKRFCPNCGKPVGTEDTCPACGYTLKK